MAVHGYSPVIRQISECECRLFRVLRVGPVDPRILGLLERQAKIRGLGALALDQQRAVTQARRGGLEHGVGVNTGSDAGLAPAGQDIVESTDHLEHADNHVEHGQGLLGKLRGDVVGLRARRHREIAGGALLVVHFVGNAVEAAERQDFVDLQPVKALRVAGPSREHKLRLNQVGQFASPPHPPVLLVGLDLGVGMKASLQVPGNQQIRMLVARGKQDIGLNDLDRHIVVGAPQP